MLFFATQQTKFFVLYVYAVCGVWVSGWAGVCVSAVYVRLGYVQNTRLDFLAVAFCLQLNFVSVFKVSATGRKSVRERKEHIIWQ